MSSSKHLAVVLCLFCLALPARAEKPNDSSSRGSLQQYQSADIPREVGGKSLDEWLKEMDNSPDPSVRAAAIIAIPNFRAAAGKAVPHILKRLRDGDASPRAKAAITLRFILPFVSPSDYTRVFQELGRTIKGDPQLIIRYEAVRTYTDFCKYKRRINHKIKEEHDTIFDLVANVRLTQNSTFELRDACIDALIYAGVDPEKGPELRVTNALIDRADFQHESTTQVRLKAIMALGAMGRPQSPTDYTRVKDVLKSPNNYRSSHPTIRIWSHVALIALDEKADKKDLDTIADYLKDRKSEVKFEAVRALGALEEKASGYVPNICAMVVNGRGEEDPNVLAAIASALGRMNNKGGNVANTLIQIAEHKEAKYAGAVFAACVSMAQLGMNDAKANKAIQKAQEQLVVHGYSKEMLQSAIEAMQKSKTKPVKPKLEKGVGPGQIAPRR